MSRLFAAAGALLCSAIAISSACLAQPLRPIHFTLESQGGRPDRIEGHFRSEARDHQENNWSTGFRPTDFVGLDLAGFRGAGSRPLRFALIREPGRLDCAGNGSSSRAEGNCSFTANPAFTQLLVSRGIGRPTDEQAFGLMAVNARRELIDAVAAARYPTPSIDNLMALSALGVDGNYISEMSRVGYRPDSIQKLVEFKALGITPSWIAGFVRVGYANVPGDGLVQLRALGVTPEYIEGYQRIGYRNLPVNDLVQLKALDVTPEFARLAVAQQGGHPTVQKLVELKIFGRRR